MDKRPRLAILMVNGLLCCLLCYGHVRIVDADAVTLVGEIPLDMCYRMKSKARLKSKAIRKRGTRK